MIQLKNNFISGFSHDEIYIIGKSLTDAWGYPYRPKTIKFLTDREEYKKVDDKFNGQNGYQIDQNDIAIVLNALELLYYENGDFLALYDGVTMEDVKTLYERLKQYAPFSG